MTESAEHPGSAGDEDPALTPEQEGERNAAAAPPQSDDAEHGQTQVPAAADDVGVPSDEEIAEDEEQ